ncbi:MAG TPA: ATP-binding cassette domain-containing protein [Acidobacteriota bacterium]|nr:ATP-binding cassette domain-containing protein [Acidobacteriota bacterium]
MIEFRNIDFSYGDQVVLTDVSFRVGRGESVVVMGPSGSGKSTILRLILGLECPQSGEILINGRNVCVMKEAEKREIRKQIGMVFQDGALFDSMTVGENVGYYLLEYTNMTWPEISQKASRMLGFVGLDPDEVGDKLPEHLSGGQRRRVAIGRALLSTDPKIMLYDEPTTGLDPAMTDAVLSLIMKLQETRGISSVVVTHQIADVLGIPGRFVVLTDGRVVFDGTLEELRESRELDVLSFLAPFRLSMADVARRKFITTQRAGGE